MSLAKINDDISEILSRIRRDIALGETPSFEFDVPFRLARANHVGMVFVIGGMWDYSSPLAALENKPQLLRIYSRNGAGVALRKDVMAIVPDKMTPESVMQHVDGILRQIGAMTSERRISKSQLKRVV